MRSPAQELAYNLFSVSPAGFWQMLCILKFQRNMLQKSTGGERFGTVGYLSDEGQNSLYTGCKTGDK